MLFDDAIKKMRDVEIPGNPHQGPKATREFLEGCAHARQSVLQHHLEWRSRSGISDKSAVCRAHKDWSEVLHDMLCLDELNVVGLVSGEAVVRKILQIETAVRRNPRQPDFEGLEMLTMQVLDETGGVSAAAFSAWVSSRQRDEAQVLKQGRLLREERAATAKATKTKGAEGAHADG